MESLAWPRGKVLQGQASKKTYSEGPSQDGTDTWLVRMGPPFISHEWPFGKGTTPGIGDLGSP